MRDIRFLNLNGKIYLHKDDVADFVRDISDTEKTDVRIRLRAAAQELAAVGPGETETRVRIVSSKQ